MEPVERVPDHLVTIEVGEASVPAVERPLSLVFSFKCLYLRSFSLEPPGLRRMVRDLQRAPISLGDGIKRCFASEKAPIYKMAKKLVAARNLPVGHEITAADIAIKSPNDGLPPYEFDNLLGTRLRRPLEEDENFSFADIESPS